MNLNQLLENLDYEKVIGSLDGIEIKNVTQPENANESSIIFLFRKYPKDFQTKAKVIVTKKEIPDFKFCQIIHQNPRLAMAQVLEQLYPVHSNFDHFIHPSSIISSDMRYQEPIKVGALCSIGENVSIGEGTIIHSKVSIGDQCKIGKNCIIHPNTTIYNKKT